MSARRPHTLHRAALLTAAVVVMSGAVDGQQPRRPADEEGFRFRSGVDLINVSVTVTDSTGRFVSGLRKEDFILYEDDEPQAISHFSSERTPVSLGLVLDTSGSMAGEKMSAARDALERFFHDLLDPADEMFFLAFSGHPNLVQDWTTDRERLSRAVRQVSARGDTALYDAVAEAAPLAQTGRHRKKAILVISDGNDTSSRTDARELKAILRESEALVYAIGIDARGETTMSRGPVRPPIPLPFPIPGRRGPFSWPPMPGGGGGGRVTIGDALNVAALRDITDDSGGRTEVIRSPRDLDPATASIADELSRQYYIGYPAASAKDGRWHSIRVELKSRNHRVRARRGYLASTS